MQNCFPPLGERIIFRSLDGWWHSWFTPQTSDAEAADAEAADAETAEWMLILDIPMVHLPKITRETCLLNSLLSSVTVLLRYRPLRYRPTASIPIGCYVHVLLWWAQTLQNVFYWECRELSSRAKIFTLVIHTQLKSLPTFTIKSMCYRYWIVTNGFSYSWSFCRHFFLSEHLL